MKKYTTSVDGVRVCIAEEGEGEPLVLLHGWSGSHRYWKESLPRFAPHFRTIAIDWPGFGDSDKPSDAPYTLSWYVDRLTRILDELKLPVIHLVGHSMGGGIAAMFTSQNPTRVRRLVLATAFAQGSTAFFIKTRLMLVPGIRQLIYALCGWRLIKRMIAADFTLTLKLDDAIIADVCSGPYTATMLPIFSMRETDLSQHLSRIRVPTHVIGTDSDAILKRTQQDVQRAAIPGVTFTDIPNSGHCPMLEQPELFHAAVLKFLT